MNSRLLIVVPFLVLAGCMKGPLPDASASATASVTRGTLEAKVVETGAVDAVQAVEVKSRVSGRLKKLFVEEGDTVKAGQLIAEIDPNETELQLRQNQAQLRGAQSSVARSSVEIAQRRQTVAAEYRQAKIRVSQLQAEANAQPALTSAAIASAKAALDSASKEIERLQATSQPNARSADIAALDEAKANLANAKSEYERQQALLDQGYVAKRVVENAELSMKVAQLRLAQAQDSHDRLQGQLQNELAKASEARRQAQAEYDRTVATKFQVATKRQDYENAVADLQKAHAALRDIDALEQGKRQGQATVDQLASVVADANRNLHETEIRAPIDGVVTKKEALVGDLITGLSSFSSGSPIVRIEDRKSLRVILNINEIDTAKVREGMNAKIDVEAIPGVTYSGTVHRIAPASNNTGTEAAQASSDAVVRYQVEVWLDSTDARLRSGMSARCTLLVAKKPNALSLPVDFVGKDPKGRFVMIPQGDKKNPKPPQRVAVVTGLETGTMVEIISGLKEGEKVQRPAFNGPERQGFMQAGGDEN
jgi:RND family efflux transporter MFP subunit